MTLDGRESRVGGLGEGLPDYARILTELPRVTRSRSPAVSSSGRSAGCRTEPRRSCSASAQTGGLAVSGVIVVALAGPAAAFLIDGATFAVSSVIPAALVRPSAGQFVGRALREGWAVVSSRGWLKVYTAHVTTLNVLALSPFFVLGPLVADRRLGARRAGRRSRWAMSSATSSPRS